MAGPIINNRNDGQSHNTIEGGKPKKKKKKTNTTAKDSPQVLIPPLEPYSPQEIASFATLDLALRSHPELAREGANILNPKALSKLVHGIRSFQDTHLGRGSKNINNARQWPMVRLPDEILRCRASNGPLFTVILAAYRQKKESSWRQFDFTSPKRYDDNIALLKRIEDDLIGAGQLKRPVIYFDETVPEDLKKEYRQIVIKFGGRVVENPPRELDDYSQMSSKEIRKRKRKRKHKHAKHKHNKKQHDFDNDNSDDNDTEYENNDTHKSNEFNDDDEPTHVVAWDGEEHDSPENIQDERNIQSGSNELEKLYLRTMIVVDPREKKNTVGGGIVEATVPDSKKKGGKPGGKGSGGKRTLVPIEDPMALVHWWYWPSSCDEWMLACDVAGEGETHPPARPKGGPWVVGCKFIRDVETFNEWGLEDDYAIVDYARKVSYYIKLEEKRKAWKKQAKKEAKKLAEANRLENNYDESEDRSLKGNSSGSIQSNESGLENVSATSKPDRQLSKGIDRRQIPTGFYSENGSRISQTVYDGALLIPSDASALMHHFIDKIDQNNNSNAANQTLEPTNSTTCNIIDNNPATTNIKSNNADILLPETTSVLRPSEDPIFASNFIVTELCAEASGLTFALNRSICNPSLRLVAAGATGSQNGTQRIRGGGVNGTFPEVGQFDDPGEGNGGNEGVNVNIPVYASQSSVSGEKSIAREEMTDLSKIPDMDSSINDNGSSAGKAAVSNMGEECKTNYMETVTNQQKLNIKAEKVEKGAGSSVEQIPTMSHFVKEGDSLKNIIKNEDVDPVLGIPSTQVRKNTPTHVPSSGNNFLKSNPVFSDSCGASSTPRIVSSTTVPALPQTAEEKKPSATQANLSILKKDDGTGKKLRCSLPILVPLREQKSATQIADDGTRNETPLKGDQEPTITSPRWYNAKRVSDFERRILPEWFNKSAVHRTPSSYLSTRERIIHLARECGRSVLPPAKKYLTSTAIRRCVPGDAGSLLRLHQFLETWGFINGSVIGELAPNALNSTKENSEITPEMIDCENGNRKDVFVRGGFWSEARDKLLINSIVLSSTKKRKLDNQNDKQTVVNWDFVADEVGDGVTPIECQRRFLSLNLNVTDVSKRSEVSRDTTESDISGKDKELKCIISNTETRKNNVFYDLVNGTRSDVVQAASDAALQAVAGDIAQAQRASLLSIISVNSLARAKEEEKATENILQEILDQRMAKLENRLSLLEDVEGILDAERISLELERRDLYTARCRHWFAGGI